jgi:small subunit ribosomal protein S11
LKFLYGTNEKVTSKKDKNSFTSGVVHIQSTFNNNSNNHHLTGDTISWASAGSSGFKGARKVLLLLLKQRQKKQL